MGVDFLDLESLMIIVTDLNTEQKSTFRLSRNQPFIKADESGNTDHIQSP